MPAGEIPAWRAGWSPDASWGRQRIIEREQFPILYAIVDHGAWVQAIDDCLQGKRLSPPALDAHQCRFGKWLDEAGRDGFDDHPSYRRITEMHDQAHRQALEILGLQAHGRRQEALERMPRLHQLRTRLLMEVNELLN